jgi:chitinase
VGDVSVAEGDVGTTTATFTVALSAASGKPISVDYTTADGTATAPSDYTAVSTTTLNFAPGETSKTVDVTVKSDTTFENDETFGFSLSNLLNVAPGTVGATGTIRNDDVQPQISVDDPSVTEGDAGTATATFTVSLTNPSAFPITADYVTNDGSASSPADYAGISTMTLTFVPGVTTQTVDVTVNGDLLNEFDETFTLDLSSPASATIADTQGIGTILDDDLPPTVDVNNVSVAEGDAGTTIATFTVSLSAPSGKTISVDYATADGTAIAPGDYIATSGSVSFAPGETSKTVDVAVNGDLLNEFNEMFTLDLSSIVNVNPGSVSGTGTIDDNDALPTVAVGDVSVLEGDVGTRVATFTVTLSAPSGKPISVDYATADGTAAAGTDYVGTSGTLNFAPGETSKTVDVTVKGDTTFENDETFGSSLSNLLNVAPGTVGATGTIRNDDPLPQISIDDPSVTEGNAGTTATFTVSLTNPSASLITVDYATANGTATSPLDYTAASGTVTFPPGSTTQTVDVPVVGDLLNESNETFVVNLTNPGNATIADNQGVGTILDDDLQPTVDVNNASVAEGDIGSTPATFTVSLSAPSGKTISVDYATADGSALAGSGDYVASSGTLTFNPGVTTQPVAVTVNGDSTFELGETFTITLSNPSGTTIGAGVGFGTIVNDDITPGLAVTDVSIPEGNSGDTLATFTVALGAPSAFPVTVDVATQDGTATQPSDYDPVATTSLTFLPGETTKAVDVTIHGDTVAELDETFTVQLSNAIGATIGDDTGIGTITDDDTVAPPPPPPPADPVASIGDASTIEGPKGSSTILTFPVTLSRVATAEVTIDYRTMDGSATGGSDFLAAAGSLRVPAGSLAGTVKITVLGDDRVEPDETFTLHVAGVAGATPGADGTGTIVNDDRSSTRLTLHVRVSGHRARTANHRVEVRGRLIGGDTDLPVTLVLMRERDGRWIAVDRTTVLTRRKPHVMVSGATAFGYRSTFHVTRSGRYRIRVNFRGDDLHAPTRAHLRFRI